MYYTSTSSQHRRTREAGKKIKEFKRSNHSPLSLPCMVGQPQVTTLTHFLLVRFFYIPSPHYWPVVNNVTVVMPVVQLAGLSLPSSYIQVGFSWSARRTRLIINQYWTWTRKLITTNRLSSDHWNLGTWEEQPIILNLRNCPLDINYAPCPQSFGAVTSRNSSTYYHDIYLAPISPRLAPNLVLHVGA